MICAECEHWTMGETWGTSLGNTNHRVVVECKGWCTAKLNKRKKWNYQSSYKCKLFQPRKKDDIIISGTGLITDEQIETIVDFLKEKLG